MSDTTDYEVPDILDLDLDEFEDLPIVDIPDEEVTDVNIAEESLEAPESSVVETEEVIETSTLDEDQKSYFDTVLLLSKLVKDEIKKAKENMDLSTSELIETAIDRLGITDINITMYRTPYPSKTNTIALLRLNELLDAQAKDSPYYQTVILEKLNEVVNPGFFNENLITEEVLRRISLLRNFLNSKEINFADVNGDVINISDTSFVELRERFEVYPKVPDEIKTMLDFIIDDCQLGNLSPRAFGEYLETIAYRYNELMSETNESIPALDENQEEEVLAKTSLATSTITQENIIEKAELIFSNPEILLNIEKCFYKLL